MTQFVPHVSRALCQLAHEAALQDSAPYALPAYRKRDRDLRKRAYFKGKMESAADNRDLMEKLLTPSSGAPENGWFKKRWELGEESAVRNASQRITDETNALGTFGFVLHDRYQVTSSAAIRWSLACDKTVFVSMTGTGYHALVASVASKVRHLLALEALSSFDRHVLEMHIGATILVAKPEFSGHLDQLLSDVGRDLLPQPGSEGIARAQLQRVAETVLEQAHGEVERIASGLHQGRTDRLHRAWSRGFFLPRGVSLDSLMESLC